MSTAAASTTAGASPQGNVGPSRPFQFAEYAIASSSKNSGGFTWTPAPVEGLTTIKNRSIYVFELAERRKPILAAEFLADDRGALRYVPGKKRREVEPKAAPAGEKVNAAWADLIRQDPSKKEATELRYVFIAIRGRLAKKVILDIEDDLAHSTGVEPIFQRWNLADNYTFKKSSNTNYVMVIDPITIGENLSKAYHTALIYAYDYIVPYDDNPHKKDVEIRARKLQLGRMIKQSLLAPGGGEVTDPMKIREYLENSGSDLLEFVSTETKALDDKALKLKSTSVELVRFLQSRVWTETHCWYRGVPHGEESIEHAFVEAAVQCTDRLCETKVGRDYEKKIVEELAGGTGILSYLFAPPKPEGEAMESFRRKANVMRRASAAFVIGFVETAPAIKYWLKARAGPIIVATLNFWFTKSTKVIAVTRRGRFSTAFRIRIRTRTTLHIHVNYKKVKADLSKWLEDGKAHWPHGSKEAHLAELVTKLFIGVEVVNLYNKFTEMAHAFTGQTSDTTKKLTTAGEVVAATLDLVVAFEDPARAWAEEIHAMSHWEPHTAAEKLAEAKKEAHDVFGKMTKPAVFKWIGAVSAALDTAIYLVEGREAWHKGEHGLGVGNFLVSGGSLLMFVGNIVSAVSITATAAAAASGGATAAAAGAAAFGSVVTVIGVVIVMIGFALIEYFHKTPWQKFADHCCFGEHPAKAGHEKWSGGDFSKWTLTKEGLDLQIEVLIAMLCAFRAEGDKGDNHSIRIYFGVIPPKSSLALDFSITYETGETKKLEYEIELDKLNPAAQNAEGEHPAEENAESEHPAEENAESEHPAEEHAESEHHGGEHREPAAIGLEVRNNRLLSMVVRAERLVKGPVKHATCEVAIRLARGSKGKVPVEGEFKYELVEKGYIHASEMDSLEVGPE